MNSIARSIASCLLAAAAVPALRANNVPVIRLSMDHGTHKLQVQSWATGDVFLVIGAPAVPPIRVGDIEIEVLPLHVLSLGYFKGGNVMRFEVPSGLRGLSAEAVVFDAKNFQLHDSNVVTLGDATADLVEATFQAQLYSTDSIPPHYALGASLTAPGTGYEFLLDGYELSELTMQVYLRLVEPGEGEIGIPVLTEHQQFAALGTEVGKVVNVYLMRTQRGATGVEVYRLMAQLPLPGDYKGETK